MAESFISWVQSCQEFTIVTKNAFVLLEFQNDNNSNEQENNSEQNQYKPVHHQSHRTSLHVFLWRDKDEIDKPIT